MATVGISEDQTQVDPIVRSELATELSLALALRIQRVDRRRRRAHRARLLRLGALELEHVSRPRERPSPRSRLRPAKLYAVSIMIRE